jgi:hypothetical protein
MTRAKTFLSVAIAVGMVGTLAITATAQAVEGPYWKIAGVRLAETQSQAVTATASGNQVFSAGAVKVTCTKLAFGGTHALHGSTGANRGYSDEILEYKGCSVSGEEGCKVSGEEVKSHELLGELVWANTKRTGKLLTHFETTSGKDFATIDLTGEKCTTKELEIAEGEHTFDGLICEAQSGKKPIEEGSEPGATTTLEVNCPETPLKESDLEVEAKLTAKPGELDIGKTVTSLTGRMILELEGKAWCVATGATGSKC